MSSEVGLRFASDIVDLCRLPRDPHERLGIKGLSSGQALIFDLSFARAARRVRQYDATKGMQDVSSKDIAGALKVAALLSIEISRS